MERGLVKMYMRTWYADMLDADTTTWRGGKPCANKSGQGEVLKKKVFSVDVSYGKPLTSFVFIRNHVYFSFVKLNFLVLNR